MSVKPEIFDRKGVIKLNSIPGEARDLLNNGAIESVNLVEGHAVDHKLVLHSVLTNLNYLVFMALVSDVIDNMKSQSAAKIICLIGEPLQSISGKSRNDLFKKCSTHQSGIVPCWATYMVSFNEKLSLPEKFKQIQYFASDQHFGVLEIAWMRFITIWSNPLIYLFFGLRILTRIAGDIHVKLQDPGVLGQAYGRTLRKSSTCFDILKSDESKYVQDSVGNWLNDASNTNPTWVLDV